MKTSTVLRCIFVVICVGSLVFVSGCSTNKATNWEGGRTVKLFNGKDIDGWDYALAEKSYTRDQVWKVEKGILKCSGTPIGVLYTGPEVKDFHLVVEYRWAPNQKPGNSGIFSRIEQPVTALPKAIEVQLKHGDAGHVLGLQGKRVSKPGELRYFEVKAHPAAGDISGISRLIGAEKPAGQWNRVEILARGPRYQVWMNGKLVNDAAGVDVSRGKVGLQSEGGEIHFRKVSLTPIPE